jgi:hypothetical protein
MMGNVPKVNHRTIVQIASYGLRHRVDLQAAIQTSDKHVASILRI